MAWHRSKAKITRLLSHTPSETSATREGAYRLPFDIVEAIIAYIAHDLKTLKACSLTCRFWYTIAVPHIHHTLILKDNMFETVHRKFKPLPKLHELGLIPYVKEIRVRQLAGPGGWFGPEAFTHSDASYFFTFANVHTLLIQGLNIDRFVPGIERYFLQFSRTLRTISLYYPTCSAPRHLSHFLSLFPNLENVEIRQFFTHDIVAPGSELATLSKPKFGGQLTLHDFLSAEAWTYLIDACGGIRFRHMVLRKVGPCAPILLGACAETLETLRVYLTEEPGVHTLSPDEMDLSQLKVLQSLEVAAWTTDSGLTAARDTILTEVFSTITSPGFSELIFVQWYDQFHRLLSDKTFFRTLRTLYQVRPFELVFMPQFPASPSMIRRQEFERVLASVTTEGLLDFLDSPPVLCLVQPYPLVQPFP